jgi:hypothetical protein
MRPLTPIKTAPIAACACAALSLSLLAPGAALASEAANPFGGVAQSPTHAAKPVTGTGVTGAGKTATGAAKPTVVQTAASKKALQEAVQRALKSKTATASKTASSTETTGGAQESKTSTPMILTLVAGVLVLGGIAFVIVRDARSAAPVVEGVTGGTRNPEGRLRKRRAQAKAARRQRKRHRRR